MASGWRSAAFWGTFPIAANLQRRCLPADGAGSEKRRPPLRNFQCRCGAAAASSMSSPMSFPCGAERTSRTFTTSSGRRRAVGSASGSSAAFRGRIRAFALPKGRSTRSLMTASGSSAMRSTSCIPSLSAKKKRRLPGHPPRGSFQPSAFAVGLFFAARTARSAAERMSPRSAGRASSPKAKGSRVKK